jgi:hypothetical protein
MYKTHTKNFPFLLFVVQALSLLEHLIKNGNERIVEETRDHMRKVRMLTDFNFYEGPIDRGSGSKPSCFICCCCFLASNVICFLYVFCFFFFNNL